MSAFGFLLIQSPVTTTPGIIVGQTLFAAIVKQEIKVQLVSDSDGIPMLKNKKTKYDKTILKAYRGDDETYQFKVTLNDAPFDLTGYEVTAQGRTQDNDTNPLFAITIIDGQDGSDFVNGILFLALDNSITLALPGICNFDMQIKLGTRITTIASGEIQLTQDVTRP